MLNSRSRDVGQPESFVSQRNLLRRLALRTIQGTTAAILSCVMAAMAYGAAPSPPTNSLPLALDIWSFWNTTNWTSDSGFAPISFTNISASYIGSGAGLVMDSTNAAWLRYPYIASDGTNEITVDKGTVMFWFAPNWTSTNRPNSGPGQSSRFIEVGTYTTNASYGWWSLYLNPGGTNIYFAAQTNNGSQAVYLSAPICWTITNYWHHIALTYSSTNSTLYLDGLLVTNGSPVTYRPGLSVLTNGFCLGSDGTGVAQVHGVIDDLETYDNVLDAATIGEIFQETQINYFLNPRNTANIASAPSTPTTTTVFQAITGSGYLIATSSVANCFVSSTVILTNLIPKVNSTGLVDLTFSMVGGSNYLMYDVFATTALQNPITNSTWAWMGQGHTCSNYTIFNLGPGPVFLIAGTPQDSDSDGLTDAYESLVSHTDPQNPDTTGVGMLDGWQIAYLGGIGFDPYTLCPCGDGWTYLETYDHGWDPRDFHTPPVPKGLRVVYRNGIASISWNTSPGPVTSYELERTIPALSATTNFALGASNTAFSDTFLPPGAVGLDQSPPTYRLRALYGSASSPWSDPVALYLDNIWNPAIFIRGPGCQIWLAMPEIPQDTSGLRVTRRYYSHEDASVVMTNWSMATNSLSEHLMAVPNSWITLPAPEYSLNEFYWFFECTNNAGAVTAVIPGYLVSRTVGFVDARRQLKENLVFLLRAAGTNTPFNFLWVVPGLASSTFTTPDDYAESGFKNKGVGSNDLFPNEEYGPFAYNNMYRNFVFSVDNLGQNGLLTTGVNPGYATDWLTLMEPAEYFFDTSNPSYAPLLSSNLTQYIFYDDVYGDVHGPSDAIGLYQDQNWVYHMAPGLRNTYGLPLLSVEMAWGNGPGEYTNVPAGGAYENREVTGLYVGVAQPNLQPTNYYFAPRWIWEWYYGGDAYPTPGSAGFSSTNATPLLFTSLGRPMQVDAWAKESILNGYTNRFGYLAQYFDKAYVMDARGAATTNEAGLLSPYGEFLPTVAGRAALVTMPDIDTGQRGTGVVNVIKLQLDVNHDGIMDLSFAGPDNTSQACPYHFWVNNDRDEAAPVAGGLDQDVLSFVNDCNYKDPVYNVRRISSKRDLEDYTRLWVCGIPALTNSGYQITLYWTNVSTGSPAIQLFNAVETNGGIGYLTDTNIAVSQVYMDGPVPHGGGLCLGTVSATNTFDFPSNYFTNSENKYLLFDGSGVGSGELVLAVSKNGQTIAQTSAWLDLRDIKEFYEATEITNNCNGTVTDWTSGDRTVQFSTVSDANESQDLIVMVHGINVDFWHWVNASETVRKRLYWAGYHGKFMTVKWPCDFLWKLVFGVLTTDYTVFNGSELQAYTASTALKTYLDQLHSRFPAYRTHLFAHSQGNAITGEAIAAGAAFDTYILTQAAMPASSYDVNYAVHAGLSNSEAIYGPTPEWKVMGYRGVYTNLTGRIVNFYNSQDPVLDLWVNDQGAAKPNLPSTPYTYDGTNAWYNTLISKRLVTNPHESRAYVSRSRTLPIGQSGPASGHGVIQSAVDLNAQFGFGHSFPDDHSAQWVWSIQTTRPYFQQVLRSCQLIPAQ